MPLPRWMKRVIGTETVGTAYAQLWGRAQDGIAEEAVLVAKNIGADSIDWYRRNLFTRMEMDGVNFNGGSIVLKALQSGVLWRVGKSLRGKQPKAVDAETRAKSETHERITKNGDSYLVYASTVGATLQTDGKVFTGQVQALAARFGLNAEGLDFEEALSKHVTDWTWGHYFTAGRWRKEITPHLVRTAYLDVLGKLQQRYCEQAQNRENLHGELQTLADELGAVFEHYSAYLAENTHYLIKPLLMEGENDKRRDEQERLASFEGENLSAEERQAIADAYQNTAPLITKAELDRQISDRIKNVPLPQDLLNYGKAYQPTEELKPAEHHLKPVLERAPRGTPLWLAKAGGYNTADEADTNLIKEGTELADEAMELGAEGVKWAVKYNVSHYLRQPMVIGGKDFNKPGVVSRAGGWILDNALSLLVPKIKEAIYAESSLPGLMILSREKVTVQLADGEMDPMLLNDLGNVSGVRLKPNDLIQRMKQKIENWPYNDRFSSNTWKERILPHVIRTCYRAQLQEICNKMADDFRSSPNRNRELLWHGMNRAAALLGQVYERYTTQLTEKGHLLAPLSEKDMGRQNDEYRKTHAALTGDRKKKLTAALDAQKPLLTRREIDQILNERVKSVTPRRADRPDPMAQFERCLRMDSSDDPTYNMPKNVLQAVLYIRELSRTNERSGFFRRKLFNREYKRIQSQLETMKQKLWAEIEGKHQTGKVSRELFNKLLDLEKPIECTFRQGSLLGYEQKKYAPPTLAEQAVDGIRNVRDAVVRTAATGTRYVSNAVHYGAGVVADAGRFVYNNRGLIARAAGETVAAGVGVAADAIVATGRYIYRHEADIRHGIGYALGGIVRGFTSLFRRSNQVQEAEALAEALERGGASEAQEKAPGKDQARDQAEVSEGLERILEEVGEEVVRPKNGPEFEIKRETFGKIAVQFKNEDEEELYSLENSEEGRKAREEHEKEEASRQHEAEGGMDADPSTANAYNGQGAVNDDMENDRPTVNDDPDIPAAQNEVPVEQNEVPAEQNEVPAAQNEVPAEQNEAPAAQNEVPAAQDEAPAAQNEVPAAQNEPDEQQPVNGGMDADQSTTNAYNGQGAVNDDMENDRPTVNDDPDIPAAQNEVPVEQNEVPAAQDEVPAAQNEAPVEQNKSDEQQPENDGSEFKEPDDEDEYEECLSEDGEDGKDVEDDEDQYEDCLSDDGEDELENSSVGGGLASSASATQQTGEKSANDAEPDDAEYVYSEDGERFTEIREDPELQLEAAQSGAVKRIQKRIEALQKDVLKNEDQDQVIDEMGSLMEYMMLASSVQEIKVAKDGRVVCSSPNLNGKTPEQVTKYLDGFLSGSGNAAEKESASALGQDPAFRSMLRKNGGDVVKNARDLVESGTLVRTYQSCLQQKNAHARAEKTNADSAPAKKNGKNLNNSI